MAARFAAPAGEHDPFGHSRLPSDAKAHQPWPEGSIGRPALAGEARGKAASNTWRALNLPWRVERKHDTSNGATTLTAVGERVTACLHHGPPNVSAHELQAREQFRVLRQVHLQPVPTPARLDRHQRALTLGPIGQA